MNEAKQLPRRLSQPRRSVKLRLTLLLSVLCVGLAVATLMPWSNSIPNSFGYYSVCSFAPISTAMLLVLGFGIHAYGGGHRRQLAASVMILVTLAGYSGFWAYTMKMPISSLQVVSIQPVDVLKWFGPDYVRRFTLTFYNPIGTETYPFGLESLVFVINGTRLVPGTYDFYALGEPYYVGAHQTSTNGSFIDLHIWPNYTKAEGGSIDTVLLALNSTFSLTLSGLLVERGSWNNQSPFAGWVVAASPFKVSCNYP